MKKSRQQKKEEKLQKRREAEEKLKSLTKTQKIVGVGIIAALILSVYSCQPTDEDRARAAAEDAAKKEEAALVEANKPKEIGITATEAKTFCNEKIKEETSQFSKVKVHFLSDAVFLKSNSGMANASIGFTATNDFGVDKYYVGYCYFNADSSFRTFEIQEGKR